NWFPSCLSSTIALSCSPFSSVLPATAQRPVRLCARLIEALTNNSVVQATAVSARAPLHLFLPGVSVVIMILRLRRFVGVGSLRFALVLRIGIVIATNLDHAHHLPVLFFLHILDLIESLRLLFAPGIASARVQLQQSEVRRVVIRIQSQRLFEFR